jgi:muramoyltetrapeptide carboxypeptidase LdcA involved in peptidoglycan recycling
MPCAARSAISTSRSFWTSTCGHVPPHLALVNGALAEVTMTGAAATISQTLS